MFSHRSRLEIMLEMLDVIMEGETKPTRIMYKANLSWVIFIDVLKNLVENNLVQEQRIQRDKRDIKRYNITEKGRNVFKYYKDMAGLINTEMPQIDF